LIVIGKIVGCFGVKGYLKVLPATHSVERFTGLSSLCVGDPDGEFLPAPVEDVIVRLPHVLIKLAAFPDRTEAEKAVGKFLFVEESQVAPPPPGSYFIHDIIGCEVRTAGGKMVGVVEDVYKLPAQDVWAIRTDHALVLFPVVKEFVERVDIGQKQIVIRPPEGLLNEEL
jgi:16S rRNA processing protein RimM